ncbi:MAG: hypothetical protein KatS3mg008_1788 [Acidimicrobiales bacterium]|nr:MAG: hypothetical protein KatS3mg008_1788 [Acidimicrobiales bacterium]
MEPEHDKTARPREDALWTTRVLRLDESRWPAVKVLIRTLPPFELTSALAALERLEQLEKAAFDRGVRIPPPRIELPDGSTLPAPGTAIATEFRGTRLVISVDVQQGMATDEVRILAAAATEDVLAPAIEHVVELTQGESSRWRGRHLLFDPYVRGLLVEVDTDDEVSEPPAWLCDELDRNVITPVRVWEKVSHSVDRRSVLLWGVPGSGKTHALRWLRSRLEGVATTITTTPKAFIHPELIRLLYEAAASAAPAVVMIEDIDLMTGDRSVTRSPEALSEFLGQVHGVGRRGVFTVATTAWVDALDQAVLQRFDRRLQLEGLPDDLRERLVAEMVARHRPDEPELTSRLVSRTAGWTFAQLVELERIAILEHHRTGEPVDLLSATALVHRELQPRLGGGGRGTYL